MTANEAQRLERTWLCSVLFADIVNYSSQSVQLQMKWKDFFNDTLFEVLKSVPTNDRVLIDTGDGASVCFLGDPEAALLSTLSIRSAFTQRAAEDQCAPRVRLGINLGPVKLVRDLNGNPNVIGDGINVAQRIMSFAEPNQILVSRSYFEVISRLSEDYEPLFRNLGARQDKHVREHIVYELTPPGTQTSSAPEIKESAASQAEVPRQVPAAESNSRKRNRTAILVFACIALVVVGAAVLLISKRTHQVASALESQKNQPQTLSTSKSESPPKTLANASRQRLPSSHTIKPAVSNESNAQPAALAKRSQGVDAALVDDTDFGEIQTLPPRQRVKESAEAEELINAHEYEKAIALLNRAIPLHPRAFPLYVALGDAFRKQHEFEKAVQAYSESLRLFPGGATAYLERANCFAALGKDQEALADYNAALKARPNSAVALNGRGHFFLRQGKYNQAIGDLSEAILISPNYSAAYLNRSRARRAMGDLQGANEDAKRVNELGH